jgi:hypothetical protein
MFHTDNQVEFKQTLRQFTEAAYANYGGHAYAAGYLWNFIDTPECHKNILK